MEVLRGTEENPILYLPESIATGLRHPLRDGFNIGFYYFSLLENVVQNDA
jgi:hypothetical protein